MDKDSVSILANVVIAFSSFIGVAGALAYYMVEVRIFSFIHIIFSEVIYMLFMLIILIGVRFRLR